MRKRHEQVDMRREEDCRWSILLGLAFDQRMQGAYQVQFLLEYSVEVYHPGRQIKGLKSAM